MGKEASILVTLRDQYSPGVQAMREANSSFGRSFDEVQQKARAYETRLDGLIKQQSKLQVELVDAKKALKEAEKAYQETGEAADAESLSSAKEKYEALNTVMKETVQASKNTQTALRELEGQNSRMARQSGGSGGILSTLGQAGAWSMLGDVASQWSGTLVSSAFGSDAGTLFSGALGGAGSGAAIGTMINPGLGTVIGAGIGALVGLAGGGSQIYQEKDDAFKSYVQEATQSQLEEMNTSIASGSATAAQRELDEIAFNRLLGQGTGSQYLSDLRVMAADTPMEYEDLTGMSRALATGFGDSPERMLRLMEDIGDAGSAVGVTAQDMTLMAQAMSRMQGSGKASLEYLNILQERGVNVIQMLADAYGKTQGQIYDMISKGQIKGGKAVDIIQAGMEEQFGGAMETMAQTYSGLTSTLADAQTEMDNAYGEGYNAERKKGVKAEIDYLSGYSGELMQEANRAMGAWQAELENSKEQYQREAMAAVMSGAQTTLFDEEAQKQLNELWSGYQLAEVKGDAAEQGRILAEARVLAQGEYNASEGAQLMLQYETDLAAAIREDAASNEAYWDAGYRKGQEYSKGRAAGMQENVGTGGMLDTWVDEGGNVHTRKPQTNGWYDDGGNFHPYATGLGRVPYNDYPALLHEGERVLTAAEARVYNKGGGTGGVTVTGNTFVVRQESDIDAIAAALLGKLRQASLAGAYG